MEAGVIAGIAVGALVGVILLAFIIFVLARKFCNRRPVRRGPLRNLSRDGQSQIRRKDGTIQAVHVKRVTRMMPKTRGADPDLSTGSINPQPDIHNGDIFVLPPPGAPVEIRA